MSKSNNLWTLMVLPYFHKQVQKLGKMLPKPLKNLDKNCCKRIKESEIPQKNKPPWLN